MLEELRESWETLEQAKDADKAVLLKEMNKIARKSGKIRAFREMWLFDNQLEYQKLSELEDGYIDAMEGLRLRDSEWCAPPVIVHCLTLLTESLLGSKEKALAKYMGMLAQPTVLNEILEEYNMLFQNAEAELADGDIELQKIFDEDSDLGVGAYTATPPEALRKDLGIIGHAFPYFNTFFYNGAYKKIPNEEEDEWKKFKTWKYPDDKDEAAAEGFILLEPRWHQLVGIHAIFNRWSQDENAIIADEVGLGKTMQCLAVMGCLRQYDEQITKCECQRSTRQYPTHRACSPRQKCATE